MPSPPTILQSAASTSSWRFVSKSAKTPTTSRSIAEGHVACVLGGKRKRILDVLGFLRSNISVEECALESFKVGGIAGAAYELHM